MKWRILNGLYFGALDLYFLREMKSGCAQAGYG